MSYSFFDSNSSVFFADSSVVSGTTTLRPAVDVASFLSVVPTTFSGSPSISGTVNIGNIPSVSAILPSGSSILSIQSGLRVTSVIGGFTDGTTRTAGDPGLNVFGVRNDTLASIVASDKQYSPHTVGSAGETVTANAPLSQWVQGSASCFTGVIQPVIAAQGSSIFTYVTSAQIANASANNVYLTIYGGASSVVSYIPVPANSGALPLMVNGWKSNANGAISASVSGTSSVYLAMQGFISKT